MATGTWILVVGWAALGCADALDRGAVLTPSRLSAADPTVCERLAACSHEPRVLAGELSLAACAAGAAFVGRPGALDAAQAEAPALLLELSPRDTPLIGPRLGAASSCAGRPRLGGGVEHALSSPREPGARGPAALRGPF
jgi:hypothetical protein